MVKMSMNKIFLKSSAFTLIELIVASMLVVIVIFGIFSISNVLQNNNQDFGQRFLVRSETQITLNHILNNAALAVGSASTVGTPAVLDQGILVGAQMGAADNNSFCIHQQQAGLVSVANPNGDIWVCYWLDNTVGSGTYQQIWYCNKNFSLTPGDADAFREANGACLAGTTQYLGTAYSITNLNGVNNSPPTFNSTNGFSITIQNCLNNAAAAPAACSATGTSGDPVNNPEVQLSGSVFPPQVSS